jgi:hypothetical protein
MASLLSGCPGGQPPSDANNSPVAAPGDPASVTAAIMSHFIPVVNQRMTEYRQVTFQPGDQVEVSAGTCVDVGGNYPVMRRYVDPQAPDSERPYSGRIWIPGVTPGLVRIGGWLGTFKVPDSLSDPGQSYLRPAALLG